MRDLDLLTEYLVRLRQERLAHAHVLALAHYTGTEGQLLQIKVAAHEAELCTRIRDAVKVLANDSGKFMKEFLP